MKNLLGLIDTLRTATARLHGSLALTLILLCAVNVGQASTSTVIEVTDTGDAKQGSDGVCTLREAIIAANTDKTSGNAPGECVAGSGADTIVLSAGTYILSRSDSGKEDACSTGDLDVLDDLAIIGGPGVTISAEGITNRVFHILSGNVTISGVTISGGSSGEDGGGIYNGSVLNLTNVTLSDNTAAGQGGGIYDTGVMTLTSSTVAENHAGASGGGVVNGGGVLSIHNTIIAGNGAPSAPDCSGTLSSLGYNLIQDASGCVISDSVDDITGQDPLLSPLQDSGDGTLIHALLPGSPAIEAGDPACPPPDTDQRGISRPQGLVCDIGTYEFEDPPQVGPIVTVNTDDDIDDGVCDFEHCSLREAINAAEAHPNGDSPDEIHFNIPDSQGDPPIIMLTLALPDITDPLVIDGTTQTDSGAVVLDGSGAGDGVNGLVIISGDSTIRGLIIVNFDGNGILLDAGDNSTIEGNTIANNDGDGIRILYGSTGNTIVGNDIHDNGGLGIDLGGDGPTPNDPGDPDDGANYVQNYPVLFRAVPGPGLWVEGRLNSQENRDYVVEFFSSAFCTAGGGSSQTSLGSIAVTTDEHGDVYFQTAVDAVGPEDHFVVATATDPSGNTSEFSPCVSVGPDNDSWPRALPLPLAGDPPSAFIDQYIDQIGQSRWYRFTVQPNSTVIVELTNLAANYDLTLYKDIAAAYQALTTEPLTGTQDLVRLNAEFAPAAFSPAAFSPAAFSPAAFSPAAFSPAAFSPAAFSPAAFSPAAFSPAAFSPAAFSPAAFSPAAFSPAAFSPAAFSPAAFSPAAFSPAAFSPAAFSSAQTVSLIGVSAFEGTASEGLMLKTWNNTGDFYVRVRGREGAFSLAAPFHLVTALLPGPCGSVSADDLPPTSLTADAGDYKTIILTDPGRMAGDPGAKAALGVKLAEFATRPDVKGVVVDVDADARVAAANALADTYFECPYAKNLVADAIKDIVDAYQELNPLEYIVIVGNDNVIPFFRYPDNALLGHESMYVPPVFDATSSQASLRLGYVLSQDGYGAPFNVSLNATAFPIPGLAVGRLVETPTDVIGLLNAYLSTNGGVVTTPTSALVTGYDFLEDAANAIQHELEAGLGTSADTLIADHDLSPADPAAWTADDLGALFLNNRYDLAFLAGHFSASSALAADYTTSLLTTDLIQSTVNMDNAIFFSAGCHSGYNIVNEHGIPGITFEPDWAQAFARKGATLVAGTGYQYGDTDFIEYSERLYLEFSRQLRTGSGPVSVGEALVAAKRAYLVSTPALRGIHEKALLEATIFGLPMLSVDMPGERIPLPIGAPPVDGTTPFMVEPGSTLGLEYADITVWPSLIERTLNLRNVDDNTLLAARYLSGTHGMVVNPAEPALPLEVVNATQPDMVLRGVGFRGGNYTDIPDVIPLIGAATTEIRGVHAPFLSDVFWPIRPWTVNYYGALARPISGTVRLNVTPVQHKSSSPGAQTNVLRRFDDMDFRLYYSDSIDEYADGSVPALAAVPTIVRVSAVPGAGAVVSFSVNVVGNPAAGIQEVWVTYSATDNGPLAGRWQSLDLVQSETDSTLWEGVLQIGTTHPGNIRFMVQAANGVGLVGLATNLGAYYIPGAAPAPPLPTSLTLEMPPGSSGAFGSLAVFTATLTQSDGQPLAGEIVHFGLGAEKRQGVTDGDGRATATIPLIARPDSYVVRASFAGTIDYAYSSAMDVFHVVKQDTVLSLDPSPVSGYITTTRLVTATLRDAAGRRLGEQTVFFRVTGSGGSHEVGIITDYAGRAILGNVLLPPGGYKIDAHFNGTIPLSAGTITLSSESYSPSTVTTSLTLLNAAPQASDDSVPTSEDTAVTVDVLANDTDVDVDDVLAIVSVTQGANGSVVISGTQVIYIPDANFCGTDSFLYTVSDLYGGTTEAAVTVEVACVNDPPTCSLAVANNGFIWSPDKSFWPVNVLDVTDPDDDQITITIVSIFQDEPVGTDQHSPDGFGVGTDTAWVRAERDAQGNGRVYHIEFGASDELGGLCSGEVLVGAVPHDQSGEPDIDVMDDGPPYYDSTTPG